MTSATTNSNSNHDQSKVQREERRNLLSRSDRQQDGDKAAAAAQRRRNSHINELLSHMSLEDKIGQMAQVDIGALLLPSPPPADDSSEVDPNYNHPATITKALDMNKTRRLIGELGVGSVLNSLGVVDNQPLTASAYRQISMQLQQVAKEYGRPPVIWGLDSVHGANYIRDATWTPSPLNLAASFNKSQALAAGQWASQDTRAAGITWLFSPLLGLALDSRFARVYETFGEDPYWVGEMATAMIQGIETATAEVPLLTSASSFTPPPGGAVPSRAAACAKHFVGYPVPRTGHDRSPSWIPTRHLYQYFVGPWSKVMKETNVKTVMESYTETDGVPNVANAQHLRYLLRYRLQFQGVLVTDYAEINNLNSWHHIVQDNSVDAATEYALKQGTVDMSMVPWDIEGFISATIKSVRTNRVVSEARIEESARRVLQLKYDLNMLDEEMTVINAVPTTTHGNGKEAETLIMAKDSLILTENKNKILPLQANGLKILVTGPTSNSRIAQTGGWTVAWQGPPDETKSFTTGSTVYQALQQKIKVAENGGIFSSVSYSCGTDVLGGECTDTVSTTADSISSSGGNDRLRHLRFKHKIKDIGKDVGKAVTKGVDSVEDVGKDVGKAVTKGVDSAEDVGKDIGNGVAKGVDSVKDIGKDVGNGVAKGVDSVKDIGKDVGNGVTESIHSVKDIGKEGGNGVTESTNSEDPGKDGGDGATESMNSVEDEDLGEDVGNGVTESMKSVEDPGQGVGNGVTESTYSVEDLGQDVGNFVTEGINDVGDFVEGWRNKTRNSIDRAVDAAKAVDLVVMCIGEEAYAEKPGDIRSQYLPRGQIDLVLRMRERYPEKPILLIYFGGRPRLLDLIPDSVNAVIVAFLPGPHAGEAIADLVVGQYSPSGRLPITYPLAADGGGAPYFHAVSDQCTSGTGLLPHYQYSPCEVQWPFGHGLSYVDFGYSKLAVTGTLLTGISVHVNVINNGNMSASEAVMVFTFDNFRLTTPEYKRLRAVEKIHLQPGESKTVAFSIHPDDLKFVGPNDDRHYIADPTMSFWVGIGPSTDCRVESSTSSPSSLCALVEPAAQNSKADPHACQAACDLWMHESHSCASQFGLSSDKECLTLCRESSDWPVDYNSVGMEGWGWNYVNCLESVLWGFQQQQQQQQQSGGSGGTLDQYNCASMTKLCRDVFVTRGLNEFGLGGLASSSSSTWSAATEFALLAGLLASVMILLNIQGFSFFVFSSSQRRRNRQQQQRQRMPRNIRDNNNLGLTQTNGRHGGGHYEDENDDSDDFNNAVEMLSYYARKAVTDATTSASNVGALSSSTPAQLLERIEQSKRNQFPSPTVGVS